MSFENRRFVRWPQPKTVSATVTASSSLAVGVIEDVGASADFDFMAEIHLPSSRGGRMLHMRERRRRQLGMSLLLHCVGGAETS